MSAPPRPAPPAALAEPVRSRFFYGMLLDEHTLTREQRYFEDKRRLLNRLGLGHGVLAGLNYRAAAPDGGRTAEQELGTLTAAQLLEVEPESPGGAPSLTHVRIAPGVALDGYGREVVVPSTTCGEELVFAIRVDDPTDPHPDPDEAVTGQALAKAARRRLGDAKLAEFYLVLEIRPTEEESEHAPVRAGSCPTECRPGAVRERFAVRFRPVKDRPTPVPGATGEELPRADAGWPGAASLGKVFPQEPEEAVRHRHLAQQFAGLAAAATLPPAGRDDPLVWVPLGVFRCVVAGDKASVAHAGRYYRQVWGSDALSRLVFGLAERVDEAARVRVLTYDAAGPTGEEGTAPVYHDLPNPLKVRVVNGHDADVVPPDWQSVRVQFDVLTEDGGKLYTVDPKTKVRTDVGGPLKVDEHGRVEVRWELGRRPGRHAVAARVVRADTDRGSPPFHPGSQLVFRATATPTAPTVVGMEFPFWNGAKPPHDGGCHKPPGAPPAGPPTPPSADTLRVFFSRKMNQAALAKPGEWLGAWRVVSGKKAHAAENPNGVECCVPIGPHRVVAGFVGGPHALGDPADETACWYADYELRGLLDHLCDRDVVRVVVAIRPSAGLTSEPLPAAHLYPKPQQLDAEFDGSFVPPAERDRLWADQPPRDPAAAAYLDAVRACRDWKALPDVSAAAHAALARTWDLFQPRARSFPSGDGTEGGEFHSAFELPYRSC